MMADKNIQIRQRNSDNTGWDNLFPITKLENIITTSEIALGINSEAAGLFSTALGGNAKSNGGSAVAVGLNTEAIKNNSIAIGTHAKAEGRSSIAIGPNTTVIDSYPPHIPEDLGNSSIAIGNLAIAQAVRTGVLGVEKDASLGTNQWIVPGDFTVNGTKNFEIPHPHPDKKNTHRIRHGAVESPTPGDTLYRYTIEATEDGQTVEIQLPDYFPYLNTNVDVWVNGHLHFGRAFGVVEDDVLKVTCEKAGKYKVLVIGTRNDDNVQDWYVKGVEREVGETWLGETEAFLVDEIIEVNEIIETGVLE